MLSPYLKIYPDGPRNFLLYSTRKGSVVRVSTELLDAAREGRLTEKEAATLKRLAMVVDDPAAEREEMLSLFARAPRSTLKFRGIAVLTLDCNLACPYCYEEGFRDGKEMSAETARLLVDTVIRDHLAQGRDVRLDFYGGEPLMALKRLKEIARPLREEAERCGRSFSFALVTNGTLLTRRVVEELLPLGLVGVSLTIDGPRDIHDRQRPFVSGKGSFQTILANVASVCDLVDIRLGGNCTKENYRDFPRLLDRLLKAGVDPTSIESVNFSPIVPKAGNGVGGDHHGGCLSSAEPWLREAALFLREETLGRGFRVPKPTQSACMIEFGNDLVVGIDGALYKCPCFMAWPELAVGTLAEGVKDYRESHNLALWQNEECLDCPYLPLCFGGCRYLTLLRTGKMEELDCRREFYDATLEEMIRQDSGR